MPPKTPSPAENPTFHDPDSTAPRPTPNDPEGGLFSLYASTHIAAPPAAVYAALLDIDSWPKWNTFVYKVTVNQHPSSHNRDLKMVEGCTMTFHVNMTETYQTTTKIVCLHVQQLKTRQKMTAAERDASRTHSNGSSSGKPVTRIRWASNNAGNFTPRFVLRAERVHEIEELEDGTTMYRNWEAMGGVLAHVVKRMYEQTLKDRFKDWCRDLKGYVEALQTQGLDT